MGKKYKHDTLTIGCKRGGGGKGEGRDILVFQDISLPMNCQGMGENGLRNAKASAAHYRISTITFHSGVKHDDLTRLNHIGVCMSPDSIVNMQ